MMFREHLHSMPADVWDCSIQSVNGKQRLKMILSMMVDSKAHIDLLSGVQEKSMIKPAGKAAGSRNKLLITMGSLFCCGSKMDGKAVE